MYHLRNKDVKEKRDVALLDLTLNKGNSGGPIIKIGKSAQDDEVIGIADFLLNPFGELAEQLDKAIDSFKMNYQLQTFDTVKKVINSISLTNSMKLFSEAIINSSNGISGCVSINHFLRGIKLLYP